MKNRSWKNDLLVIFMIVLVGVHLNLLSAGLSLDDWYEISLTAQGHSYWDSVKHLASGYLDRPINLLLLPLIHRLSGIPRMSGLWVPQTILFSLELIEGWLLFLLLKRLTGRRSLALSCVAFALLFPNRSGIHYRATLTCLLLAQDLILASLLIRLRWRDSRSPRDSALSLALYALGLMSYESAMLMPLFVGGALAGRGLAEGKDKRRLAAETVRLLWPYGLVLAGILLWKWIGIKLIFGVGNPKAVVIHPSVSNLIKVFIAGFGCVTLWPISLSVVRLKAAIHELHWLWFVLPVFVFWLSRELQGNDKNRPQDERAAIWALWGACIAGYIGTYAPYVLSGSYMPYVNGIMSRLNGMGAWIGGMLLASLAWILRQHYGTRHRIPALFVPFALTLFVLTNWVETFAWADASRLQKDIIAGASRHISEIPQSAVLYLTGVPRFIHGAPVFEGADFIRALQLATNRDDISGNTLSPQMRIEDGMLVEEYRGGEAHRHLLDRIFIYDHPAEQMRKGTSLHIPPAVTPSLVSKILLGPGMEP
ncbi:MAG: hypothetical protein WCU88_09635 [Elusimicrobiota bacterium]